MITVFGFTFGDAMREMLLKFSDEPFAITYTSAICLIFFSSIAQIYVVLFMSQFEEHLEESEELMEKMEEKKRKNRERLLLMDLFDQKTFSIQANAFINYLEGGDEMKNDKNLTKVKSSSATPKLNESVNSEDSSRMVTTVNVDSSDLMEGITKKDLKDFKKVVDTNVSS